MTDGMLIVPWDKNWDDEEDEEEREWAAPSKLSKFVPPAAPASVFRRFDCEGEKPRPHRICAEGDSRADERGERGLVERGGVETLWLVVGVEVDSLVVGWVVVKVWLLVV